MTEAREILEQPLDFELPYTNTLPCYDALANYPSLEQLFRNSLAPAALRGGPLQPRMDEIEAQRKRAYSDYLAEHGSLREVEWPFDCCIADLYYALFDSLAQAINGSELSFEQKGEAMGFLEECLSSVLAWNSTKRMEIGFSLLPE